MVSGHSQDPISPRTHPRWRNTGRALAPPLLFANLLYKPPAPCPAEGSGCQTGSISAMVKDRPRAIAPSSPSSTACTLRAEPGPHSPRSNTGRRCLAPRRGQPPASCPPCSMPTCSMTAPPRVQAIRRALGLRSPSADPPYSVRQPAPSAPTSRPRSLAR
jgi:hypothetical protein